MNSNNGALLNGAGFAAGKVGQAFSFNGSRAHVRIKDEPNLRFTTGLTIETWVNPASGGTDHQIVSKWDAIVGINQRCYGLSIWEDNRAYLGISTDGLHLSGTTTNVFSVNTVPTGQWTHIAATYDGTTLKIYLNGVLENTSPLSGSIFPGTNDLAIGGVVGGLGFGDLILPFDGLVDEVSLYNRALSAGEIQAIYTAGSAGKCTGPISQCSPPPSGIISFWPADGNPQDLVGGNGGVSLSGATFAAGKVGQAFSFNGSGAHVRVKDAPNLHVTTSFSLESWFFRQGTGPAIQAILDKWDAAPGFNQRSYGISLHDNLATFGGSSDGVSADGVIQSTTTIPTNQWIHMVGTYDGATMKLYLNGVLNNSAGFTKGFFPGTNDFAIGGEVGGLPAGSAISTFQGLIDEPTIYSRALSSNEVLAIYNAGAGGKCRLPLPPVITSQPGGRTVPAGTNVTFNVAVIGATPLNYRWKFNGSNILGATNVSLTLSNVQVSASGNYSVFVSNVAGATNSNNAVLTVNGGSSSSILWAVNFFADKNPGLGTVKHGLAAIGHTTNDFWNGCSRDGATMFDFLTFVAVTNLLTVDGLVTEVDLTLTNAPGAWFNGSDDAMYNTYLYPFNGSNLVVEVSSLPAGAYDFYVYGHGNVDQGGMHDLNGVYQLSSGGVDYGTKSTATNGTIWQTTNWTEGEQYVVFRGVMVTGGQKVVLTGLPGVGGEALIAGLQIQSAGGPVAIAPVITNQPASQTVAVGATVNFNVSVGGTSPFTYQWKFNGTNIPSGTNSSLTLSNAQVSASGNYSVFVSNTAGSTNSSNAVLTVNSGSANILWAVNFFADKNPGLGTVKHGLAAIGHTTNDVWNGCSRDGATMFDFLTFVAVTNLLTVDGVVTEVDLTLTNAPGAWFNGSDDAMYNTYLYPFNGSNLVVEVSSLPAGAYDFYVYGHGNVDQGGMHDLNGVYQLSSGGVDYGTKSTATNGTIWQTTNWTEGEQYVVFRGVLVAGGQKVVLTGLPGVGGEALIAGLQMVSAGGLPAIAPVITNQPASQSVAVGTTVNFNVGATGTAPLSYQWRFNGTNIGGGTNSSLTLSNVQLSTSGNYSVMVSNTAGSTNSSNAVLVVVPICTAPPSGIVSWWPGESNANDLIGGNAGVLLNGATFAGGKVGQAFNFNGTGAHVRVKDAPNLHLTTAMTLEVWIFRQGTGPAIQAILDKWDAAPGFDQRSYGISLHDNLATFGGSSDGVNATGVIQSTTTIPTNQWVQMVGTYDGSSMKLYLNGVLNNSTAYSSGFFPGTNDFAIGGEVGGLASGSAISTFKGLIDEPTVYNRAISSNEVLAIYNAGVSGKCAAPAPPSIVTQPASRTVPAGVNVTFNVAAIGATPLGYQWRVGSSNISGATNASLTLSNVQVGQSGNYSVFVSNLAGSTNSSNAVLTVLPPAPSCLAPPSGLISWWAGESNANDLVGGNPGTLINGAGFAAGEVGQAFSLNGSNQYVRIPNNASLNPGGSFSIEGWVNATASSSSTIFGKWGGFGAYLDQRSYILGMLPGGVINFGISDAAHQLDTSFHVFSTGSGAVPLNVWTHLAAVYDQSTGTRRIFVNGVNVTNRTDAPITVLNGIADVSIGAALVLPNPAETFFPGMIDEVSFYGRALSTVEIQAIYNAGSSGKCRPVIPTSTSLVVVDTTSSGVAAVPVNLLATGSENSVGFSLNFNTSLLAFAGATLGNGTPPGTSLLINSNLLAAGKVGVGVGLPANTTFAAGTRELVKLNFITMSPGAATTTPVTFGDQPTLRQVSDVLAHAITATYSNGIVTIPFLGFEGDVAPRTNGDGTISITDWVQVGRFVAGLDTASITPNEFQRADCAPRSTLGDGVLAVADWVQAGRYSVGLDPLTSAGGPISAGALFNPAGAGNGAEAASTRTITAVGGAGQAGQAFTVPVQLNSLGNESAVGFSATFDPAALTFTGADLGAGAAGATLNVNSDSASAGVVGIALALPIGSTFATATQELVRLNFTIASNAKDGTTVSFASQPVVQQIADANAETLGATYVNATITVLPVVIPPGPTLSVTTVDGNLVITWPVPASGFQLESTDDLSSGVWTPVSATAVTNAAGVTVTIPTSGTQQFFRLRHN